MKKLFPLIIVFLAFLVPGVADKSWMPSFYMENVLLLAALIGLLLFGQKSLGQLFYASHLRQLTVPYSILLIYLFLMTLLYVATLDSMAKAPYNIIMSIARMKPWFFLVVLFAFIESRSTLRRLSWLLILIIFLETALLYCQSENLFNVNSWLTPLYHGDSKKYEKMKWRVVGSFANPNNVGSVLSFLATLAYARLIYGKGILDRLICGLSIVLALVSCIWLVQSRQGTFCILIGCASVQLLSMIFSGRRGWSTVFLVVGFLGFLVLIGYVEAAPDSRIAERFGVLTGRSSVMEDSSLQYRFQDWQRFFDVEGMGVFLGQGRQVDAHSWDSGYLSTLREAGIPGVALWFLLIILPAMGARRRIRELGPMHPDTWLHVAAIAVVFPVMALEWINGTWTIPLVMTPLVTVMALSLAARKIEDREMQEASWYAGTGEALGDVGADAVLPGYGGSPVGQEARQTRAW